MNDNDQKPAEPQDWDNHIEQTPPEPQEPLNEDVQPTPEPEPVNEPEKEQPVKLEPAVEPVVVPPPTPAYVLPPRKYKLKTALLFSDFFVAVVYIYYLIIRSIIGEVSNDTFSFRSNKSFAYYCVFAITIVLGVLVLIFKSTKSARTRFERANQVRQNPNLKVWLIGFDWGWPVLFLPTMLLMLLAGVLGLLLNLVSPESQATAAVLNILGGTVILVGAINAAVVIFKLKPMTLGLILGAFLIIMLILLLHGSGTFLAFFKGFRHLGFKVEPLGYIMLAYIWFIFLRIIWLKSLFFYWVFLPNRLELQHGLSESNDAIDREDLRHKIDTDDVILRWFNIGIITFYFPNLDRLPITNVVWGIRKKAIYANRIASVKTMQD